jgi:hypothetical protein
MLNRSDESEYHHVLFTDTIRHHAGQGLEYEPPQHPGGPQQPDLGEGEPLPPDEEGEDR